MSESSDDSSAELKTTKVKPKLVLNIKPINKAKVISKIQQLLDEINTQSKLLPQLV